MGYMRDVPSYRVECKRRIILIRLPEFAIRQKTELHKRLEAVADTPDKPLTKMLNIIDFFLYCCSGIFWCFVFSLSLWLMGGF